MMGMMGPDPMMGMMGPDPMMGMMGPDPYMMGPDPYMMGPDPYMMGPDPFEIANNPMLDPELEVLEMNNEWPKEWGGTLYYDQYSYDAARLYNGVYYINYGDYLAAMGGGGGSPAMPGSLEPTTMGDDVVYASGSSTPVGDKMSNTAYDLMDGNDIAGKANEPWLGMQQDDFIKGNLGDDTIYGGNGNDWLKGGNGDDYLEGGTGNDVLVGGIGNDILKGGTDSDVLVGGSAFDGDLMNAHMPNFLGTNDLVQDTFVFQDGDGNPSWMNSNRIVDWETGIDKFAYSDDGGTTYLATPFGSGVLDTTPYNMGPGGQYTVVHMANNSEAIFFVDGLQTIDDSDVTTVVT